jgi:predicted lipid-binding transport protein (Tim44 family)
MPLVRWLRSLATLAALAVSVLVWTDDAEARLDGDTNFGGSGVQAFALPPVAPLNHNVTRWPDGVIVAANGAQPGYPGGSLGELFNRPSLLGGFAAGFLGAGLLGLVFGHGMVGDLGGSASFVGLFCQLALIVMLIRVIWTWWRGGNDPAFADLSPRQLADAYGRPRNEMLPTADSPAIADNGSRDNEKK